MAVVGAFEDWFGLGLRCEDEGRASDAISAYRMALNECPDDAEAWFNLGNVLRDSEQVAEAEDAFRRATVHDPHFAWAWFATVAQCIVEDQTANGRFDQMAWRQAIKRLQLLGWLTVIAIDMIFDHHPNRSLDVHDPVGMGQQRLILRSKAFARTFRTITDLRQIITTQHDVL